MLDAFDVTIAMEVLVVDCEQRHIDESRIRRTIDNLGTPPHPCYCL